jgi:hypothetical protein
MTGPLQNGIILPDDEVHPEETGRRSAMACSSKNAFWFFSPTVCEEIEVSIRFPRRILASVRERIHIAPAERNPLNFGPSDAVFLGIILISLGTSYTRGFTNRAT